MSRQNDDQLSIPSAETLAELSRTRHEMIEPAFEAYIQGLSHYAESATLPTLELLSSSDICVNITRSPKTSEIDSVHVSSAKDPTAINFMGYDREQNCVAFKGEARLFSEFIEFTSVLLLWKGIEGAFGAAAEVRVPTAGLVRGLNYDEFAARVEIVEYVMFANSDGDTDSSGADIDTPLLRRSPTPTSFPPTPGFDCSLSDILNSNLDKYYVDESPTDSPTDQPTTGFKTPSETPSSASSSSLSPPPEEIKTPPSMKHHNLRPRVRSESVPSDTSMETARLRGASQRKSRTKIIITKKRGSG